MVQLAHKIRIYPSPEAEVYLRRSCGVARFAWNWALARWRTKYAQGERGMSGFSLVKEFNSIKKTEFPWTAEVSKWAPQKAIQNLGDAFGKFFRKETKYPRFKKKGKSRDSFYVSGDHIRISNRYLKLPKLAQPIKMAQALRFDGDLRSVVISRDSCGDWFASFSVVLPDSYVYPHLCETQATVGVDVGIASLVTLSTGEKIENPRALRSKERKLRRLSRSLARKQRGSKRREKARLQLARTHRKVTRIRRDATHRVTSRLVKAFRVIGIEDLNVRGMLRNHRIARSISDAAFRELRRQLEYKAPLARSNVALAARFYPSSKLCSACGAKRETLSLNVRVWECPCGAVHDRDENAARNLDVVAQRYWETINARGEGVRPPTEARKGPGRRRPSTKRESERLVNREVCGL
ncbi:MAG: transposase [Parcubacteria group bacterium]